MVTWSVAMMTISLKVISTISWISYDEEFYH